MTLALTRTDAALSMTDGETELMRYVFVPDTPQLEAPKPYIDPIRTRAGRVVSLFRPWDHVWHKGIAWSLPVVGDENFWGGPTYLRDQGYVQQSNDGTQRHVGVVASAVEHEVATFSHDLEWVSEGGQRMFTERRTLSARVLDDTAWALTFETSMTNSTDGTIAIGSPTTRGRENAGYGGLFWRGPRSFTDGLLVTAEGTGTGSALRGQRHEWMGYEGRHDEVDASSLVVMVDAASNPHHPPQWFARSEEFAALNPAPFFSEEVQVRAGETVSFRYAVGVADAGAADAARIADGLRPLL
ncbi:PmoA family protein [Microbacterium arabinogalactanolyticum]|uniref:DUF6807 domain-containing protein n=1 Tax=Microbacterium arabinogalactanolyticum TaxID=69365 RepID=UPI0025550356|nr:PmoA family protein [Microbacterium arabinogalactanolyticum]GLC85569.1 hypothetical protein MIAR_21550 [Microbacterium arabinogalactanolyticum]